MSGASSWGRGTPVGNNSAGVFTYNPVSSEEEDVVFSRTVDNPVFSEEEDVASESPRRTTSSSTDGQPPPPASPRRRQPDSHTVHVQQGTGVQHAVHVQQGTGVQHAVHVQQGTAVQRGVQQGAAGVVQQGVQILRRDQRASLPASGIVRDRSGFGGEKTRATSSSNDSDGQPPPPAPPRTTTTSGVSTSGAGSSNNTVQQAVRQPLCNLGSDSEEENGWGESETNVTEMTAQGALWALRERRLEQQRRAEGQEQQRRLEQQEQRRADQQRRAEQLQQERARQGRGGAGAKGRGKGAAVHTGGQGRPGLGVGPWCAKGGGKARGFLDIQKRLGGGRAGNMAERKKTLRDLQRKYHPDKNDDAQRAMYMDGEGMGRENFSCVILITWPLCAVITYPAVLGLGVYVAISKRFTKWLRKVAFGGGDKKWYSHVRRYTEIFQFLNEEAKATNFLG